MQLPIDIKAVVDEATDIESARSVPLSVSVYIDDTAPGDLVSHIRRAFASASPHTRVTLGYLEDSLVPVHAGDDMAVIVAGLSSCVGKQAAHLRAAGIPVMVATTLPHLVADVAKSEHSSIPCGDIVSPEEYFVADESSFLKEESGLAQSLVSTVQDVLEKPLPNTALNVFLNDPSRSKLLGFLGGGKHGAPSSCHYASEEPLLFDKRAAFSLDRRMGEWIIEACREKRLAFALAFPFVRRPLSVDAVNATSLQNAGIGLVLFIPGADMPVMTLNQAKMLLQIAAAYGQPMNLDRVKELAAVVGGAFACRTAARQLVAVVPVLGWAIKAAIGYAGTFAMGHAAIEYFEGGGNISGLVEVVAKARAKALEAAAATRTNPVGRKIISTCGSAVRATRL